MLVTYRRVKSSEHSPASSDDRKIRPALHKATTVPSLEPTSADNRLTSSLISRVIEEPESSFVEDDGEDTETEFPEVALDHNTHIVPHWLLRYNQADRRHRAASISHSTFPSDTRSYLSPGVGPAVTAGRKSGNATLSTPDLSLQTRFCPQPSPLSRHATLQTATPTPANSPKMFDRLMRTNGEHDYRPSPVASTTLGQKPACGFGGTGSTMVNTKLKDHVFSAIWKRMSKRHRLSTGSLRKLSQAPGSAAMSDSASTGKPSPTLKARRWGVVEDGDVADTEGESSRSPSKRFTIPADDLPAGEDTSPRGRSAERYGMTRRAYSEDMTVSLEKMRAMAHLGKGDDSSSPEHGDVFHMELDGAEEDIHMKQTLGSSFLPLARKRSRSRSLGPSRLPIPPRPSLAIPRGRCDSKTPVPPSRELPTHPVSAPANAEPSPTNTASASPRQNHFILMEDLTGRLKKPCVLDLKMGTRQYGMDATPAKKKSQRKKCDKTTSRPLGVRVCGMQVSWARLLYSSAGWEFLFAELPYQCQLSIHSILPFPALISLSRLPVKSQVADSR